MTRLRDELRGKPEAIGESRHRRVTVVMTVKNDPVGCATTLGSLTAQSRQADEIIVVDGGSTDGTRRVIRQYAGALPQLRLISAKRANIAKGRNIGTSAATYEIIATTDSGCRADPDWLANLVKPFETNPETEFVAGFYRVSAESLLEEVIGGATMRGALDPVNPETFNPSARSMAYTKALWRRAGGWPDWVRYSEDTLFDHKIRNLDAQWQFTGDAIVSWRPRTTLSGLARQFYHYGTGRGHTQIGGPDFVYNLRNMVLVAASLAACLVTPWAFALVVAMSIYFYGYTFHRRASRLMVKTQRTGAYPLCMCVMWVVLFSNTLGYVVGSWQRWRDRPRYETRTETYLAVS